MFFPDRRAPNRRRELQREEKDPTSTSKKGRNRVATRFPDAGELFRHGGLPHAVCRVT